MVFSIGKVPFGNEKTVVIAEAGVNHNGRFALAKKLIEKAASCKANAIKFQIFNADDLALKNARMANYQIKNLKTNISQHKMLKSLELKKEDYIKLKKIAHQNKIDFLVSVFDEKSLNYFEKHIKNSNLPNQINKFFKYKDINKIVSFMLKDKKNNSNKISLVLLKKIALPIIKKEYDKNQIKTFLKSELIN